MAAIWCCALSWKELILGCVVCGVVCVGECDFCEVLVYDKGDVVSSLME